MKTCKNRVALLLVMVFTLGLFAATPLTAQAAPVDITNKFTDPNFRAAVYRVTGKKAPAPILDSDVAGMAVLHVSGCDIQSLAGVEYFTGLEALWCGDNQLTSLPALPSDLKELNCNKNQLTSLPVLPSGLTTLRCEENPLVKLPDLPSGLEYLQVFSTQLTALPDLPSGLKILACMDNQLTELPTLPPGLEILACSGNQLTGLPALPTTLITLNCHYNQLTVLPPLPSALTNLSCDYNQLTSLPTLPSDLKNLNCDYNSLTSLPTLPSGQTTLWCQKNQLTTLPELPSGLCSLSFSGNRLSEIDLTGLNQLEFLHCAYNNMTELSAVAGFSGDWDDNYFIFHPQSIARPPMSGLSSWAVAEADALNQRGIIPLPLQNSFRKPIRRDEVTAMLVNAFEYACSRYSHEYGSPFTDISDSDYASAIKKAYTLFLVEGTSSTTFSPAGLLTREQTAKLLYAMVHTINGADLGDGTPDFTDTANISDWAKPYVAFCQENNIMQGSSSGKFDPKGHLTREQAMLVVERLIVQYDW